jgi:NAD(P)H dehydrogenase (quinone)
MHGDETGSFFDFHGVFSFACMTANAAGQQGQSGDSSGEAQDEPGRLFCLNYHRMHATLPRTGACGQRKQSQVFRPPQWGKSPIAGLRSSVQDKRDYQPKRNKTMKTKILVVFYSMYGHIYKLAEEEAAGAREVPDCDVELCQVPELMSEEALVKSGAKAARAAFKSIPVIEPSRLAEADGIIFGTPTRFGNMCAQMRNFLDQTGGLWMKGALVGKAGSVFTSTATQHGGQETTITSFHSTLLHHGMVVVGVPYAEPRLMNMTEITGGSPYGASTLAGPDGSRQPSANELAIARYQGKHVAAIAKKLAGK